MTSKNSTNYQEYFEQLNKQFSNNTLPHALLLAAPKGAGKLEFARAVAKMVLSEFKNDLHPDYYELMPEEDKKNISVDQVRSLIFNLSQTANYNGYKVAVIYPAETLNIAASNALLKTLEEPLGKTLIILCAHQQSRLLPTIVSRCQRIPVKISSESIKLFDDDFYKEGIAKLNDLVQKKINPIKLAETWAKEDVENITTLLYIFVSDHISQTHRETPIQSLYKVLDKITDAKRSLQTQSNPNKQLLLENLLLELSWN